MERVKTTFPADLTLDGLKVVIDCANGAAYRAAPEVLWELGAEVDPARRHARTDATSTTAAARPTPNGRAGGAWRQARMSASASMAMPTG